MRISDWSSDVCSSDLLAARRGPECRPPTGGFRLQHLRREQIERAEANPRARQCAAPLDRKGGDQIVHFAPLDNARAVDQPHRQPANRRGLGLVPGQRDEARQRFRSEEHTSELQSLMRISYAVFCLKKKKKK